MLACVCVLCVVSVCAFVGACRPRVGWRHRSTRRAKSIEYYYIIALLVFLRETVRPVACTLSMLRSVCTARPPQQPRLAPKLHKVCPEIMLSVPVALGEGAVA